jgi:hypothetical protein
MQDLAVKHPCGQHGQSQAAKDPAKAHPADDVVGGQTEVLAELFGGLRALLVILLPSRSISWSPNFSRDAFKTISILTDISNTTYTVQTMHSAAVAIRASILPGRALLSGPLSCFAGCFRAS